MLHQISTFRVGGSPGSIVGPVDPDGFQGMMRGYVEEASTKFVDFLKEGSQISKNSNFR